MSKHVSEKFLNKIEGEGVLVKENGVRFTVSHLNRKGKLLMWTPLCQQWNDFYLE